MEGVEGHRKKLKTMKKKNNIMGIFILHFLTEVLAFFSAPSVHRPEMSFRILSGYAWLFRGPQFLWVL